MHFVLAAAPQDLPALGAFRHTRAFIAYALDAHGALLRSSALPHSLKGGFMGLSERGCTFRDTDTLCRAILAECRTRAFTGVFADFECERSAQSTVFLDALGCALSREGKTLFVPLTHAVPSARLLVGTAVSGGTLEERLLSCIERFGPKRLALDCERLSMDFTLPCRRGEGAPLSAAEIERLRARVGSPIFYSKELVCSYFSYCEKGTAHFVAFDTAETIHRKLALAEKLGIDTAFFMYPEVRDILGALF